MRLISAHCSTPTTRLLLARADARARLQTQPDTPDPAPSGSLFDRRRWVSIQAAPTWLRPHLVFGPRSAVMVTGRPIIAGTLLGAGRRIVLQFARNVRAEGIKRGAVPDSDGPGGSPDGLVGSRRQSRRLLIHGSRGNGPANLDVPDGR